MHLDACAINLPHVHPRATEIGRVRGMLSLLVSHVRTSKTHIYSVHLPFITFREQHVGLGRTRCTECLLLDWAVFKGREEVYPPASMQLCGDKYNVHMLCTHHQVDRIHAISIGFKYGRLGMLSTSPLVTLGAIDKQAVKCSHYTFPPYRALFHSLVVRHCRCSTPLKESSGSPLSKRMAGKGRWSMISCRAILPSFHKV